MIQTSTASPFEAKTDEIQDKEAIRKEIRNMRHTRDSLVQQRQELDERQHRVRCVINQLCKKCSLSTRYPILGQGIGTRRGKTHARAG